MCEKVPVAVTELPALAPLAQLPCRRSSCFDQSMIPYNFDSIGVPVLSRVVNVALTGHTDSAALAALPIGTIRMMKPVLDAGASLDQTSVSPSLSTPLNVLVNAIVVVLGSRGFTDTSIEDGWNASNPSADATAAIPLNSSIFFSAYGVVKKKSPPRNSTQGRLVART
jgi:hypothetical protein